jgi:hypothetical protein
VSKRVIRKEIDGSVSCGGFWVNTDAQVGGVSGYRQVEEVDTVIGFMGRAKLDVPVNCVDVLQYVVWVCACGVVDKEYVIHVSSVQGQDLGVSKVFDDGFFKML